MSRRAPPRRRSGPLGRASTLRRKPAAHKVAAPKPKRTPAQTREAAARHGAEPAAPAGVVRRPAVSWYPGHMHKAQQRLRREMEDIDAVLELRDARLPATSGNPELARIAGPRPRLLLLNKAALADPAATRAWQAFYEAQGVPTLALDAESRSGLNLIFPPLRALTTVWAERFRRRGIRPPHLRLMVVGMPNVGKSTFINRLVREHRLKTAPMPGVTRSVAWVQLRNEMLLLDTPGVMLPRIDDETAAQRLGWIGALPDAALGAEALATSLLAWLLPRGAAALADHYGLEAPPSEAAPWLAALCRKRGFLLPAGGLELHRGAETLLADFRAGKLGRYTLEAAPGAPR
jgi:ribosome biogenesis GTPase A